MAKPDVDFVRARPGRRGFVFGGMDHVGGAHVSAGAAYQKLTLGFAILFVFALASGCGCYGFFNGGRGASGAGGIPLA